MFASLGHGAVVRRHHQQYEVDAGGPGHHGMHQPLVAGHVDEAEHLADVQRLVGVPEVDGDTARLLFRQAVGVHAGQACTRAVFRDRCDRRCR